MGENIVGDDCTSPREYFAIFPRRKFSPVIFESNHFLTFFVAFNIIIQSIVTTGTSLVSLVIGSSNVTVSSSFSLISLSERGG